MTRRSIVWALGAIVLAALPLRAQGTDSTARATRSAAPIVVTAEASPSDLHALLRDNSALARQLRKYDAKEERLQAHLDSLKVIATKREDEINHLSSEAAALRATRLELEAQIARLEAARGGGRAREATAARSGGSEY